MTANNDAHTIVNLYLPDFPYTIVNSLKKSGAAPGPRTAPRYLANAAMRKERASGMLSI